MSMSRGLWQVYQDRRSTPADWPLTSEPQREWGGWCTLSYADIVEIPFYEFLTRDHPSLNGWHGSADPRAGTQQAMQTSGSRGLLRLRAPPGNIPQMVRALLITLFSRCPDALPITFERYFLLRLRAPYPHASSLIPDSVRLITFHSSHHDAGGPALSMPACVSAKRANQVLAADNLWLSPPRRLLTISPSRSRVATTLSPPQMSRGGGGGGVTARARLGEGESSWGGGGRELFDTGLGRGSTLRWGGEHDLGSTHSLLPAETGSWVRERRVGGAPRVTFRNTE